MSADLLAALGEPVDGIVVIDFETTYSKDYQLRKLTTESYVRDERFQCVGVGVQVGNRPGVWLEEHQFRAWAAKIDWSRIAILHHHAHFDGFILAHHFGIKPGFWLDTLSMARAIHGVDVGGSLAKLSEHYGLGEKGKEVLLALGKRREDFTPEEYAAYGRYCVQDCNLTWGLFYKMLPEFLELELWAIDTTIRMFTEPTFKINVPLLEASLEKEKKKKADLLTRINADKSVLMSADKFAALLIELGEEPPKKISPRTGKETWAFAKSDEAFKALLESDNDEVRWLCEARVGVRSTIVESRTERLLDIAKRGLLPIYLAYHKAHTGRFAGSDKINPQNFNRNGDIRDALEAAEDGDTLVVADSTAIEAKVLAWLAVFTSLVKAFAENRDVYSEFASKVYRRKVDRKLKLADGTKPDDVPGRVGKVGILGLGYGMSWAKLAQTLLAGPMGAPPVRFTMEDANAMCVDVGDFADDEFCMKKVKGIPSRLTFKELLIHCAVCKHVVDLYREESAPIVQFWKTMDRAIQAMYRGEEFRFGPGGCCYTVKNGIVLPSGRMLRYPGLDCDEKGSFTYLGGPRGKKRTKIYGGLLAENCSQAIARDVIVAQMLWTRVAGYHIALSTHDEQVAAAPDAEGQKALDTMVRIMSEAPPWAPGLPLAAEGGFNRSYGAAK